MCNEPVPADVLKQNFGYWMTDCETKYNEINNLLDYITKRIHLEPFIQCSVEPTLLKTFITDQSKKSNFLDLSSTEVKINNENISILFFFVIVTESYDLELIFIYHKLVFRTILTLIWRETLKILNHYSRALPINIVETFVVINRLILPNINQQSLIDLADCLANV